MLEIYNETIRDLLAKKPLAKLDVRQTRDGLHGVPGLTTVDVSSLEEVQRHMEAGANARSVGAHDLNARSSRSHLLVSLDVTTTRDGDAKTARLHLVDLAGSERLSRTGATGDRLKEAQAINKSLSALGDVINALAKKIPGHVPSATEREYRALQGVVRR